MKYHVKINDLYFVSWGEDGTQPTFTIDDNLDRAHKFESDEVANEVADRIGGEVVPVE